EDPWTARVEVRYLIPQPTVTLTVDRSASLTRTCIVTVTGALKCDVATTGSIVVALRNPPVIRWRRPLQVRTGLPWTPNGTTWQCKCRVRHAPRFGKNLHVSWLRRMRTVILDAGTPQGRHGTHQEATN